MRMLLDVRPFDVLLEREARGVDWSIERKGVRVSVRKREAQAVT